MIFTYLVFFKYMLFYIYISVGCPLWHLHVWNLLHHSYSVQAVVVFPKYHLLLLVEG